jgi:methylated-DNA-[protein]-cysteine S-methyltransferase
MAEILQLLVDRATTPIGELIVVADQEGRLRAMDWADNEADLQHRLRRHYGAGGFALAPKRDPGGFTAAMDAYFAGDVGVIDNLPVATAGTPFHRAVWAALRAIPCGTTLSYAALARRVGRPSAVRAVGFASGANPISVVVPCHRVVGSDGGLTGYGGGIDRKRWLLAHEAGAGAGSATTR